MFLQIPDQSLHKKYLTSFLVLIISSLVQGALIFFLSYYSGDFILMCCILTPFGIGYLIVNILTYRECRRLHVNNYLSYRDAVFISAVASISNVLPIVFALLAFTFGFIIGGDYNLWMNDYNPWMNDISAIGYFLGTILMLFIYFPFNIQSTLIAFLSFIYIKRSDPWTYQPEIKTEGSAGSKKPFKPNKGIRKLIIFISDGPPPPGATVFKPDGSIEQTPDTPELQHEWTVRKMTMKIERYPDDGEWYFERGSALFALGRFAEAIPDFTKLIGLLPEWPNYYRLRGLCYYHINERTNALRDLRRYRERTNALHDLLGHRELSKPVKLDAEAMQILEELERD